MSVSAPSEPGRLGDLRARVLVALPAAAAAIAAVALGGAAFAAFLALVGAVAADEAQRLLARFGPVRAVAVVAAASLPLATLVGDSSAAVLVLLAALPAAAFLGRGSRAGAASSISATMLVIAWIGLPLSLGVLLRESPDGELLVLSVLLGTFLGDTGAHIVGASLGRRPLAPRISPRKTVEGLVAGIAVGTLSVWVFALLTDGFGGWEALGIGLAVTAAAPAGDLFESLLKRDAGVKDTGRLLGPHGGVLDRIDAALFAVVAGYYASLVLV